MPENTNATNLLDLDRALDLFASHLGESGHSTNTIIAYRGDVSQLIKYLHSLSISSVAEVKSDNIEEFKKNLGKNNYTAKSVSRKLNSIKNFFSFLLAEGVISADPSREIKHPQYSTSAPNILKPMEYRALRDACRHDARATALVELMLQSGLRISEIAALLLEDIKDNELFIRAYESHTQRSVPLNQSARTSLRRYIQEERQDSKSKNVFITKTGRPLLVRNIRSLLNRYFAKAGIQDSKVNDLRNTFIVFQLEAGVPIDIVSRVVGHKRISTTEKYLELISQSRDEGAGFKLKEL